MAFLWLANTCYRYTNIYGKRFFYINFFLLKIFNDVTTILTEILWQRQIPASTAAVYWRCCRQFIRNKWWIIRMLQTRWFFNIVPVIVNFTKIIEIVVWPSRIKISKKKGVFVSIHTIQAVHMSRCITFRLFKRAAE